MMAQRHKPGVTRQNPAEQALRDLEVLRANRELAAYFKGQRTEREARAALKTIKAFVRDRERRDAISRPPLPGMHAAKGPKEVTKRKAASDRGERRRPKTRRTPRGAWPTSVTAEIEPQVNAELPQPEDTDDRASE